MIDDAWTDPNIVNQNFAYGLRDLSELNAKDLSPNVASASASSNPPAPTVSNGGNFGVPGGGTFGGGNATGQHPHGGGGQVGQ